MNKITFDKLLQDVASDGLGIDYGAPITDLEDITFVEGSLNLSFVDDYKWFLQTYGSLLISNTAYCGIEAGNPKSDAEGTVLGETLAFRKLHPNLGHNYLVLINESNEWWEILDNNSGVVYSFDPFDGDLQRAANNFEEYLILKLKRSAGIFE
ncbi:SMI1/KNR4 family protein [Agaribacterium sp. ZY112]|uniref:SMI1/KNR4 family protein n=1 Tax=Agaribacterium sp. ZY112 TaxID=3233574 RepID=UPI0035236F85